jgi:hypothetical protein
MTPAAPQEHHDRSDKNGKDQDLFEFHGCLSGCFIGLKTWSGSKMAET